MRKLTMGVAVCAAAVLTGCTKPTENTSSGQQHYSVQVLALLGGRAMTYHITDHQANKLYLYGSGPKDPALRLIQTIDLSSAGQGTLTIEAPKNEDREQEN